MSDKIPGSSYDNPVWHRGWRIFVGDCHFDHPQFNYAYVHDDYDGAEDANDHRCGHAPTIVAAKAEIDHHEQEALLEQFEGGDMGDVEFTELALELGMDMADIEKALHDQRAADEEEAEERANGPFGAGG